MSQRPSSNLVSTAGSHLLCELDGCEPSLLRDAITIEMAMFDAATQVGATIVGSCFHRFTPEGVSGVLLIAESHFSIHTWPDECYAAIDVYTCGRLNPAPALVHLAQTLQSRSPRYLCIYRGSAFEPSIAADETNPGLTWTSLGSAMSPTADGRTS